MDNKPRKMTAREKIKLKFQKKRQDFSERHDILSIILKRELNNNIMVKGRDLTWYNKRIEYHNNVTYRSSLLKIFRQTGISDKNNVEQVLKEKIFSINTKASKAELKIIEENLLKELAAITPNIIARDELLKMGYDECFAYYKRKDFLALAHKELTIRTSSGRVKHIYLSAKKQSTNGGIDDNADWYNNSGEPMYE